MPKTRRITQLTPQVLRTEPQFRLLFTGQLLSVMGDRMMLVALPFAVLRSGGGTGAVGVVVAVQLVPFVVFGLIGGALSDRSERRKILIRSDLSRMLVQGCAAGLLLAGAATPLLLGVLVVLYGTAEAFFQPAFTGLLPQTVSHPGQLQPANALRGLSFSTAAVVGPALAGALVAGAGPGAAFLFDSASFAISVACLLRLRPLVAERATEAAPPPLRTALRAGWREVTSRRWLRAGLLAMSAYHALVLPAVFVLGPVFISRRLGGPGAWAAVAVAFGLGSIAGDLSLLRVRPRRALRVAAIGLVLASLQAAVYGAGAALSITCALQFVTAIGVTVFFTLWEVSLQEHIPGEALSRVSSWDYLSSAALMPVGAAVAGPLAAALGARWVLEGMSALGVATALMFLATPAVRALPRGSAGAAGS
ncbi:MAG TPA: MFS transporter [Solirubrobacteraceae bacterium]|nr:MFS transporter [Solirubrobacteraceae bacterium]